VELGFDLAILYRGRLASCNYACSYCPFAKRRDSRAALARDAGDLARFVDWVASHRDRALGILFTPWGEALIRKHYQDAFVRLSHLDHVKKVAAQTNLSWPTSWLARVNPERVALWCTYHPSQVAREQFLDRLEQLRRHGIRFSVGMVGLERDLAEIEEMRGRLPRSEYLWVNAYKRDGKSYTDVMLRQLSAIDPLFEWNNQHHRSLGERCAAGERAISVDGDGTVRRCHFVAEPIGNLYTDDLTSRLAPRPCPNRTCGCHIGYVHLDRLGLYSTFGDGLLERIPRAGRVRLPVVAP
jgi:MoaA/NifB/PqqE/SkfB family radical SAM enzyme